MCIKFVYPDHIYLFLSSFLSYFKCWTYEYSVKKWNWYLWTSGNSKSESSEGKNSTGSLESFFLLVVWSIFWNFISSGIASFTFYKCIKKCRTKREWGQECITTFTVHYYPSLNGCTSENNTIQRQYWYKNA